ncbi:MAG: YIP1 family protein [Pseudomonadales bacterium]
MNDETNNEQPTTEEPAPLQPQNSGFDLGKVIDDAKAVLTDPAGFYRAMPTTGGFAEPAIFVAVMGAVIGVLMTLVALFGGSGLGAMAVGVGSFIMMPIMAVIGSFIAALIMFVIWKLMGSDYDYETAYRCVAYATAIYPIMGVLGLIPYIGTIVGVLWGMYLMYNASVEVHKIKAETARMVIGILAAVMLFMQVSGEIAMRKIESSMDKYEEAAESIGKNMEGSLKELENLDEMSPEEAGRKLGEFFKGMSEGMEEFEQGFEQGTEQGSAEKQ